MAMIKSGNKLMGKGWFSKRNKKYPVRNRDPVFIDPEKSKG